MKEKKALFLDRDGVINVDHGYIYKIEDFQFTEGIFKLLHLFRQKGYLLFIVTNQSGIGRDYYSLKDFETLTQWMLKRFKEENLVIEEVAYCPHAPKENCHCRKPHTGMVDEILKQYSINLSSSWLIGDKQSDIDLALNSNIAKSISIGERKIDQGTYHFNTIPECSEFLEKNKEDLL